VLFRSVIVSNTPKTLKEILPVLFNLLLGCLASASADKRQIAAATLVDIVKKLGERILPDIIPILESGLNSERSEQRQGVCIGLTEIMASTSKDNILAFSDSLIPTVRRALVDPLPAVRMCAARTFDSLHNMIGVKALEEVAGYLMDEVKRGSDAVIAERALDGLVQIMHVKSRALLPYLIPMLTQAPVNIHAMCHLCSSASVEILGRHFTRILNTLVQALASYSSEIGETNLGLIAQCEELLLPIEDDEGIKNIVHELLSYFGPKEDNLKLKLASLDLLKLFCSKSEADYSAYVDDLMRALMGLFNDANDAVVLKAWECVAAVVEMLKGNMLVQRIPAIRASLRSLTQQNQSYVMKRNYDLKATDLRRDVFVKGFCMPKKGIACILPVFKEGLLNGTPDIKEQSAQTLCDCIRLADGEALKTSAIAITGPLIRVLGERYAWSVKSAVLDAIYHLLLKVDATLRPFVPQLQPTFVKALNDPNRIVRLKSGYALARLLPLNPKLDQVIVEIHNTVKGCEDVQIKETLINSLRLCLNSVGAKLLPDTKVQLLKTLKSADYLYSAEQAIRVVSAGALGSLVPYLSETDFDALFADISDFKKYSAMSWTYLHANCMMIAVSVQYDAKRVMNSTYAKGICTELVACITSDRTPICMSAIRAAAYILEDETKNDLKIETDLATYLARCINNSSNDVKLLAIRLVNYITASIEKTLDSSLLKIFIPMLVNGTKEKSQVVRITSEIGLINLLRLNQSGSIYNHALEIMEKMRETFADCVKALSKDSFAQAGVRDLNIDETVIVLDS